jgi:hypothetical protein
VSGHRVGGLFGRITARRLRSIPECSRIWIQSKADLTAALSYERRKPVGKGPDRGQGTSPP